VLVFIYQVIRHILYVQRRTVRTGTSVLNGTMEVNVSTVLVLTRVDEVSTKRENSRENKNLFS
jgi:hypothetical protein